MNDREPITPEILTVIQTAAAVFVAKLHSDETQPDKGSRSWSSQGREIVQASHNLVQRGTQRGH